MYVLCQIQNFFEELNQNMHTAKLEFQEKSDTIQIFADWISESFPEIKMIKGNIEKDTISNFYLVS